MVTFFAFAAHNTIVAVILSLFVYGLTRVWRNPPIAHLLWLLVLLKLMAPPVLHVDWPEVPLPRNAHMSHQIHVEVLRIEEKARGDQFQITDVEAAPEARDVATTSVNYLGASSWFLLDWNRGLNLLLWLWIGGAVHCLLVAAIRIFRFEQLLRDTLPASATLQRITHEVAGRLGVQRVPDVRFVECVDVPFLWCAGRRPTIVLPIRLLNQFNEPSVALIVAHELAHLKRRDHWVRVAEIIIASFYWWNPVVWTVRRQIHQAEDLCCDGWVRWAFPDSTILYAEVLLKTAESLNTMQVETSLLPASPFLQSHSLKARIEMILEGRFAPHVSTRSMLVVALVALLVLPTFVQSMKTWAASADDEPAAPASISESSTTSEFPHVVRFEQGATQFIEGDDITVTEIRGTAETFMPGEKYWIKGTYTLASRDKATLAAYTTAADVANGKSKSLKVQSTVVERGTGTFNLVLPMLCKGWPHVSYYPRNGGSGFGGNYFGTGDSVLKKWWGSDKSKVIVAGNSNAATALIFPYAPKLEQGATHFLDGDSITITEVQGTAETFKSGNIYWVKGTYTLASRDKALLLASTTMTDLLMSMSLVGVDMTVRADSILATDPGMATGVELAVQRTIVQRGTGTFTLFLPMKYDGAPHVNFCSCEGGETFGGNYFGTDRTVLKRWEDRTEKGRKAALQQRPSGEN